MKLRILFLFILFGCCKEQQVQTDATLTYLPTKAAAILKISNLSNFKSELKNNAFLELSQKTNLYQAIHTKLQGLRHLTTDANCTIAFYELGKDNFDFLLLIDDNRDSFALGDGQQVNVEHLSYEGTSITKYELGDDILFGIDLSGKLLFSSSQILLENSIRGGFQNKPSPALSKLFNTSDKTKSATLFIDLDHGAALLENNLKAISTIDTEKIADWVSVDFSSNQNSILLNGVSIANDTLRNAINLFKGTTPVSNSIAALSPKATEALISFSFNDYNQFAKNQKYYLDKVKEPDTIFSTIEELGIIYLNNKKAVVLNSFGAESLSENITALKTEVFNYQGSEILQLNTTDLVEKAFKPLLTDFKSTYCTIIANAFVFAEDRETLQTIIANIKSAATFDRTALYQTAKASLANEASIEMIANEKGIQYFMEQDFLKQLSTDFKKIDFSNYTFASQLVADQNFYHTSILISNIKKEIAVNSVAPLFTVELDSDLALNPRFVKNHRTNQKEILVQDKDNYLYLISSEGKIRWKKQLEGPIRGKVHQVDLYKNGKLQLAFCTSNQFLVLDRNGDEVAPFDKKFESGNLNGLAVFDYENTRNYRFVVTQGRKVFMFDGKGKIVEGFTYTEASSPIIKAPEHFRISKKDYLVFLLEDNAMTIRHRAGQERIKVNAKIDFSDNNVFLYKNKFSITDKKGVLHQIDTKGKLTTTNFNLNQVHGMFATSKTLVLMNENILSIKGKKIELELGVYTAPKIFYIYDKIYVSVTDIQSQQIYLFDSQAKAIPNFPVYGSSLIDLTDMDGDKRLDLVAKDQENSIIVYKMN
ncbi:hypothetical protein MTsPCn5_25380 [Croceitalea sp. MTPC5]|uniref:ribonuclease HII n=1 Tax=Croceitalea sp. MTPC5 TaxID=3056565 RepID=UPI002B3A1343|nr:hypothetical protein MTsPCn5_25380 [Croceitalea sp. MTPC5]